MPPIFPILSVSVSFAAVDIAFALTQFEITLLTCTHTQVRVPYPYSTLAHTLAQHHHYYIVANALCSSCMCNAIKIDTSKNYSDYTWAVGNRKQLYCEHKCTAAHWIFCHTFVSRRRENCAHVFQYVRTPLNTVSTATERTLLKYQSHCGTLLLFACAMPERNKKTFLQFSPCYQTFIHFNFLHICTHFSDDSLHLECFPAQCMLCSTYMGIE